MRGGAGVAYFEELDSGANFCWSPDGRTIAVSVYTGLQRSMVPEPESAQHSLLPLLLFDLEPDGDGLGVRAPRVLAPLDEMEYERRREEWLDPAHNLTWSTDGRRIAGDDGGLSPRGARVIDLETGTSSSLPGRGFDESDSGAAFAPDCRRLATPSDDTLRILDPGSGAVVHQWDDDVLGGRPERVHWSPDGRRLAVATDRGVTVLDSDHWQVIAQLPGQPRPDARTMDVGDGRAVAWSGDGSGLAVLGTDLSVRVWSLRDPSAPTHVLDVDRRVDGIALCGAGEPDAVVAWGRCVLQCWDLVTGVARGRLDLPVDAEGRVFRDEDGRPLEPGGYSGAAAVEWDPAFTALDGHGDRHWVTAFPTGVVVRAPDVEHVLRTDLAFVLQHQLAWPAHWALDTPALEVHDTWATALDSPALPALRDEVRRLLAGRT